MNEIKVIDRGLSVGIYYNGQPVCTTEQLATAYDADRQLLTNNFNRNKERYHEGKHYFCLTGEELKAYKTANQNDLSLSRINQLYLWTERGALLHAKSLNTDKAWEVYERLVDFYFNVKEGNLPASGSAYKKEVPLDHHSMAAVQALQNILNSHNMAYASRKPEIKEPFAGFYDINRYYIISTLLYDEYCKLVDAPIHIGALYRLLGSSNIIENVVQAHGIKLKKNQSPFVYTKSVGRKHYHTLVIDKNSLQGFICIK